MDDQQVLDRIGALVEEEHTLERQATGEGLDQDQQAQPGSDGAQYQFLLD